jgi:hypothetical protein
LPSTLPGGADWPAPSASAGGVHRAAAKGGTIAAPRRGGESSGGTAANHSRPSILSASDRKGGKPERQQRARGKRRHRHPAPRPVDGVTEQCRGRHSTDSGERPQRKDECRQHPEERGERQRTRIRAELQGDRKQPKKEWSCGHRDHRPERKGGRNAEQGDSNDFDEVNREDEPCRGAEAFQGGDGGGLPGDVEANRIADRCRNQQAVGDELR